MRFVFLVLIFTLGFGGFAGANPQNPPPNVDSFRWLYEILFSESDRFTEPNEAFKSFYVHLLDSYQEFPHTEKISAANLRLVEKVEGNMTYVNVIKKKYSYDILKSGEVYVLNVRVHFKDPVGDDLYRLHEKFLAAAEIWNRSRIDVDFKYVFKFEVVNSESEAHFSVNLLDQTRGPYDRQWSRAWSANTIAHELGHMLGLGDEYQTLSGKVDCLAKSLMCSSSQGNPMLHHYYFILRRLIASDFRI